MTPTTDLTYDITHEDWEVRCDVRDNPRGSKLLNFTEVRVLFGGKVLGVANLGGRWDKEAALKEFKKTPKRFTYTGEMPQTRTDVQVFLGDLMVAEAQIPGIVKEPQVKRLLTDSPLLFQQTADGYDAARKLGLVA